jgi:hypothetical protein
MLTYAALGNIPALSVPTIVPESLESFVMAEKNNLVKVLGDYEQWALKNIKSYPALPRELVFEGKAQDSRLLVKKFLMSIRVNPELSFANFVLYAPAMPHRIKNNFSAEEKAHDPVASLFKLRADAPVVEKIGEHEKVTALEVLASASEEPDHGLDLGLWDDNQSAYAKLMGFGPQPFGNPTVSYSSQAPFHMGFYFEKPFLYWIAGWLKRCYPEYRISMFLTLAQHAFSTGHSYWGYRFLGWALHYIQDLTQPYHAALAPGWSWLRLIALNALEIIGIKTPAQNLRQLLTNRHLALENYEFESVRNMSSNDLLKRALSDTSQDKSYVDFYKNYPRKIVAQEAHARANMLDALITKAFPARYVLDPAYIFTGTDPSINMRELAFEHNWSEAQKLEMEFLNRMRAFGAHTRNVLKYILPKP